MLEPVSLKLDPVKKDKKWYQHIPLSIRILLGVAAFAWALELIDLIPKVDLDGFGVKPRTISGLIGIPLMPFLHADLSHLISNTLPFLVLGWIVITAEKKKFIFVTATIILLGGFGTWLIGGSDSNHIGASGLVYGYFGYVMTRAIMERKLIWIITGIVVAILYGSLIVGVLPMQEQAISWQGHLCGLLAGSWLGWKRTKRNRELEEKPEDDVDKIIKDIKDAAAKNQEATDKILNDATGNKASDNIQKRADKIHKEISDAKKEQEGSKNPTVKDKKTIIDVRDGTPQSQEKFEKIKIKPIKSIRERIDTFNELEEANVKPTKPGKVSSEASVDSINKDLLEAAMDNNKGPNPS